MWRPIQRAACHLSSVACFLRAIWVDVRGSELSVVTEGRVRRNILQSEVVPGVSRSDAGVQSGPREGYSYVRFGNCARYSKGYPVFVQARDVRYAANARSSIEVGFQTYDIPLTYWFAGFHCCDPLRSCSPSVPRFVIDLNRRYGEYVLAVSRRLSKLRKGGEHRRSSSLVDSLARGLGTGWVGRRHRWRGQCESEDWYIYMWVGVLFVLVFFFPLGVV